MPPAFALALSRALQALGHDAEMAATPALIRALIREGHCGVWVFDDSAEEAMDLLSQTGAQLIPIETLPDSKDAGALKEWIATVVGRLELLVEKPEVTAVRAVWILAGSAGAAPAVQSFLNALGSPPPVAFLYVQHFDMDREAQLTELVPENPLFTMRLLASPAILEPGTVHIVSPACRFAIAGGRVSRQEKQGWGKQYSPDINESINELVNADVAERGVIVFSGMGADGANALPGLTAAGGVAWAQDPDDAICSAMPAAALASGCVSRSGTPDSLAKAFLRRYPA